MSARRSRDSRRRARSRKPAARSHSPSAHDWTASTCSNSRSPVSRPQGSRALTRALALWRPDAEPAYKARYACNTRASTRSGWLAAASSARASGSPPSDTSCSTASSKRSTACCPPAKTGQPQRSVNACAIAPPRHLVLILWGWSLIEEPRSAAPSVGPRTRPRSSLLRDRRHRCERRIVARSSSR